MQSNLSPGPFEPFFPRKRSILAPLTFPNVKNNAGKHKSTKKTRIFDFGQFFDFSQPKRSCEIHRILAALWNHNRIQFHAGKLQMWNSWHRPPWPQFKSGRRSRCSTGACQSLGHSIGRDGLWKRSCSGQLRSTDCFGAHPQRQRFAVGVASAPLLRFNTLIASSGWFISPVCDTTLTYGDVFAIFWTFSPTVHGVEWIMVGHAFSAIFHR